MEQETPLAKADYLSTPWPLRLATSAGTKLWMDYRSIGAQGE